MKVKGVTISTNQFDAIEAKLEGVNFSLRDFADKLVSETIPAHIAYEAAKRHLQDLRRSGLAVFDRQSGCWQLMSGLRPANSYTQLSEPLLVQDTIEPPEKPVYLRFRQGLLGLIILLTCLSSIGALVFINATFALEFAETPMFRFALVTAFMACDLLRPLLVARGIYDMSKRAIFRGCLGILVAISLAPLSVLSSTTVLSATMQLGVHSNERSEAQSSSRDLLRQRYDQLKYEVDQVWAAHADECNRGGCGPKARLIAEQAQLAEQNAEIVLRQLLSMTAEILETSSFVSRTVQAFEELGLFHREQLILLPLLIALTLELAALFGPALLLARKH